MVRAPSKGHLIYDKPTSDLWDHADGSGSTAAVLIAVLDNKATLTHLDLAVI